MNETIDEETAGYPCSAYDGREFALQLSTGATVTKAVYYFDPHGPRWHDGERSYGEQRGEVTRYSVLD